MKSLLGLLLAIIVLSTTSGCSIIDRLFLLNTDNPYGRHGHHYNGACGEGACGPGGCEHGACGSTGCEACVSGTCRHDQYGGLAKHRLTPEERAALECSDYGAVAPAGPPSGSVAYPYYTTRGPRDFLAKCPPSIGP